METFDHPTHCSGLDPEAMLDELAGENIGPMLDELAGVDLDEMYRTITRDGLEAEREVLLDALAAAVSDQPHERQVQLCDELQGAGHD